MNVLQNSRILVVDDDRAIHTEFRKILQQSSRFSGQHLLPPEDILFGNSQEGESQAETFEISSALQGEEGVAMIRSAVETGCLYAVAFVEIRMPPGCDGVETIARMWEAQPDLQIVICTAYSDYSWEDIMKRFRCSENLLILKKPFDNIEVLQLAHALTRKWQVTKQAALRLEEMDVLVRQRSAEAEMANARMRSTQEHFHQAFEASPIPIAIHTLEDGRFIDANDAFLHMAGYEREGLLGRTTQELGFCPELEERAWPQLLEQKSIRNLECEIFTATGEIRQVLVSMDVLVFRGERHALLIAEDTTEKRKLEGELRQAQKMEAVGQLAAGVAHDFNNILTIIQGHSSLQLAGGGLDPDVLDSFRHIASAGERAANLTRQLLAFSRKQVMQPQRLDLNHLIRQLHSVLPRLIGEHIRIVNQLSPELPSIFADACNMEQIILNLAVNARDAMPGGGTLTIRTEELEVSGEALRRLPEAVSGPYVCLSVRDTGIGMDKQTRSRIFEPFFTTKEIGKGTGMGLATVYGIVKQHNGWLEVESREGEGSVFKVFLAVTDQAAVPEASETSFAPHATGAGRTVLVVEDDPSVRRLVKEILLHYRYRVLEAEDGEEALILGEQYSQEIVILLTDMVMPHGISGRELAQRLLLAQPELKVIYTSGYSAELFDGPITLEEGVNYLPKPYTSSMLAEILRGALEPVAAQSFWPAVR